MNKSAMGSFRLRRRLSPIEIGGTGYGAARRVESAKRQSARRALESTAAGGVSGVGGAAAFGAGDRCDIYRMTAARAAAAARDGHGRQSGDKGSPYKEMPQPTAFAHSVTGGLRRGMAPPSFVGKAAADAAGTDAARAGAAALDHARIKPRMLRT